MNLCSMLFNIFRTFLSLSGSVMCVSVWDVICATHFITGYTIIYLCQRPETEYINSIKVYIDELNICGTTISYKHPVKILLLCTKLIKTKMNMCARACVCVSAFVCMCFRNVLIALCSTGCNN